jgi:hypothetical protein
MVGIDMVDSVKDNDTSQSFFRRFLGSSKNSIYT